MNFKITTEVDADSKEICQTISRDGDTLFTRIMNLSEAGFEEALEKLGWTSPKDTKALKKKIKELSTLRAFIDDETGERLTAEEMVDKYNALEKEHEGAVRALEAAKDINIRLEWANRRLAGEVAMANQNRSKAKTLVEVFRRELDEAYPQF